MVLDRMETRESEGRLMAVLDFWSKRIAWSGGKHPPKGWRHPRVSMLFREQCLTWALAWREIPPRENARILYKRARHDAFASLGLN